MKLVIDIDKREYERVMKRKDKFPRDLTRFENIIVKADVAEAEEEQEQDVLDMIIAEIMQLDSELEVVDYDHNDITRIKTAHWIIREEVLWIIDKYKKIVRNKE